MNNEVTLVGGGLVGSLLALLLARQGFNISLFESRKDLRKHDISAGRSINLALANRGIAPLIDAGIMDDVKPLLIPMRGRMVHLDNGDTQLQPYGTKEDDVIYSISRGELNKLLLTKAEETHRVSCHFNAQIDAIDINQKQLLFADGSQAHYETLLGTDGANSVVRKAILGHKAQADKVEPLAHSYKELCIPAINGKHQLDQNALHIWPRGNFMTIALPNLDGSFTVTLFMPNEGEISFSSIDTPDKLMTFFNAYFADLIDLLPTLTEDFFNNPTGSLATVRCDQWHLEDSVLLLGDAAHAIVPFHGQGMNCGFEDCRQLMALLSSPYDNTAALFEAFHNTRKPNADAIADMALENYVEMRDSVRNEDFLLKKALAFKIQTLFPKRFIPRYAMVMFSDIPYAEAQRLGKLQNELFTKLIKAGCTPDNIEKSEVALLLDDFGF